MRADLLSMTPLGLVLLVGFGLAVRNFYRHGRPAQVALVGYLLLMFWFLTTITHLLVIFAGMVNYLRELMLWSLRVQTEMWVGPRTLGFVLLTWAAVAGHRTRRAFEVDVRGGAVAGLIPFVYLPACEYTCHLVWLATAATGLIVSCQRVMFGRRSGWWAVVAVAAFLSFLIPTAAKVLLLTWLKGERFGNIWAGTHTQGWNTYWRLPYLEQAELTLGFALLTVAIFTGRRRPPADDP